MNAPLVMVGRWRVKEGRLEDARRNARSVADMVRERLPREAALEATVHDDTRELVFLHVHPDEESLRAHLGLMAELGEHAMDFLEAGIQVDLFGAPSPALVEQMRALGAPVLVHEPDASMSRLPASP